MVVYTTKDGDFEVEAEDLQVFMQRYPNAQKVGIEKTTISSSKPEVVGEVKKIAAPVNLRGLQYVVDAIVGLEDIKSGVVGFADAGYMKLAGYSREEQVAAKKVRDIIGPSFIPGTSKKQLEVLDVLTSHKYVDETGRELDVADLARKKEWGKMGELGFQYAANSAPSLAISMAGAPGVAILGLSTAGNTYFEDLANRPDESVEDITYNSLLAGFSEAGTEFLGGRFLRGLGDIASNTSGKAFEKAAKEYTEGFGKSVLKNIFKGGGGEAFTESLNSVIQETGNVIFYDDEVDKRKYMDGIINSTIPAFMLGGKGGAFATLNNKNKQNLYKFAAPNSWKQDYFATGKKIDDTIRDIRRAKTPNQKKKLQKELDALIKIRDKKVADLTQSFDNMTDKEFVDYAKNLDKINENNAIIGNKKFSETNQEKAEKENLKLIQENFDLVGKEYTADNIAVEKIIGEALKASEIIEKRLKKLKGINREDLEVKILENQEQVDKLIEEGDTNFNEEADGMFVGKNKKGKAQIYINKQVANLEGATNVVGHELLHYMISRQFKTDNASMKPLIDDLKSYLQKNHGDVYNRVQQRIDKFYTDENGNIKEGALEEYIEVFSDLISKQKIDLKDAESKGLRGKFDEVLLGFGLKDVKIETAQDLVKFINNYTNNINRQGLLGKLMGTKILDARIESSKLQDIDETEVQQPSKESRSKAVDAVNEIEQKLKNRLKAEGKDYTKEEFQKSNEFNSIFRSINLDNGPINNYIKSLGMSPAKTQKTIESVSDRLLKYNPQAERKTDSKKEITIGERIMSDTQFAKLDAARDLAIEGKRETPTDIGETTKEGDVKLQVAAEPDVQQETFETEDISPAAQARKAQQKVKPKESEFRRKIGIETGSDLYNKVLETARKVLLRAYKIGKPVRQIQRDLRNEANLYLFKDIKNFLGTKQYISNLKKFREPIMKVMFTSDLVQMEREVADDKKVFTKFVKKITTLKEVQNAVDESLLPPSALNSFKRDKSVNLYEKANPTEEQFLSFFDIPTINPVTGIRSGKRGTRKDQLAKYMSGALTYDATLEVAQEKEVAEKRQQIAELNDETVDDNDVQVLAAAIDRNPSIKFSKSSAKPVVNRNIAYHLKEVLQQNKVITKQDFEEYSKNLTYQVPGQGVTIGASMNDKDKALFAREGFNITNAARYERAKDETFQKQLIKGIEQARKNGKVKNSGLIYEENANKIIDNNTSGELTEGSGDAYISYASVIFGIEHKLGVAQFVSRTLNAVDNTLKFTTKNDTIDQKTGKPFEKAIIKKVLEVRKEVNKFLSDNNIETIKDFNKPLSLEQIAAVKAFKSSFQVDTTVSLDYVMRDYVLNKYADNNSQSFLTIEGSVYLMETDSDSYINAKTAVDIFNLGKPEDQQIKNLKFTKDINSIDVHIGLQVSEKGIINHRLRPKLNSDHFEKSNVNIYKDAKAAKEFGQALDKAAEQIGLAKLSKSIKFSRSAKNPTKGISILDFDDTLATTKSLVKYTAPDGVTGTLNAEQFASTYQDLQDQGYTFDFSDFNKVVKGKLAPLFQKALKLQNKFGPENMFVLTARPPAAQQAIFDFLKANGLNIPLKNITGLGNSTAEAKALWVADKVADGYNDFYFADDALQNVQAVKNMLDQFDVKSKVQQAKVKFSKNMSKEFNDILQDVTGIETQKRFSEAKAKKRGEGKGRFRFFIPPSHEDFVGLLYNFIGEGEKGNKHRDFFEKALIQPLNRAYRELNMAKQAIANDYRNLTKQMPDIRKKLTQSTPDGDFTYDDAVRVYLWNKFGFDIPGLTKTDTNKLIEFVNLDGKLKMFADKVGLISKIDEGYVEPGEHWLTGSIKQDLADATGRVGRKKFFAEFIENSDQIFGKIVNGKLVSDNANKIRAAYGDNFVEALEDMLYATQNGTNRKQGSNKQVNAFLDYLNGSVGATMFFNARSAVLQTLSTVNFINFADNNIFKAAARFADQPQFWKDFSMIFNSDYLKQRRAGVGFDVNGAEIAAAVKKSKEPVKAAIAYILNKGFLPTQMADSFAIALGGSSMYRNRVNTYLQKGLSKKEAETKAFEDFQATAESTQQSARPDMLSQLQRSALGRMIFAFQNVTSQYARLIKKSTLDLVKRRKTPPYDTQVQSDMSNISKIIYYGAIQNLIFYSLQSALFAMSFEDDEDEDKKNEKFFKTKKQRLINGSIDSILRGSGLPGAVLSVVKNAVIKYGEQNEKGWGRKLGVISDELLQISPPVGIKIRKLDSFEKTMAFNQKVIPEMDTFDLDNPIWDAYGNLVEGATNVPVARLLRKVENVRSALNSENAWWQRVALGLGWSKWELGIEDKEIKEVKERIKNTNKQINKETKRKKFKRKTFKRR